MFRPPKCLWSSNCGRPWYTVVDLKDQDDINGIVLVACVQIIDKQWGGDEQPAGEMGDGVGWAFAYSRDPRIQNTTDASITHVHCTYT